MISDQLVGWRVVSGKWPFIHYVIKCMTWIVDFLFTYCKSYPNDKHDKVGSNHHP